MAQTKLYKKYKPRIKGLSQPSYNRRRETA